MSPRAAGAEIGDEGALVRRCRSHTRKSPALAPSRYPPARRGDSRTGSSCGSTCDTRQGTIAAQGIQDGSQPSGLSWVLVSPTRLSTHTPPGPDVETCGLGSADGFGLGVGVGEGSSGRGDAEGDTPGSGSRDTTSQNAWGAKLTLDSSAR